MSALERSAPVAGRGRRARLAAVSQPLEVRPEHGEHAAEMNEAGEIVRIRFMAHERAQAVLERREMRPLRAYLLTSSRGIR